MNLLFDKLEVGCLVLSWDNEIGMIVEVPDMQSLSSRLDNPQCAIDWYRLDRISRCSYAVAHSLRRRFINTSKQILEKSKNV